MAIESIDQDAGKWRDNKERELPGETDKAEKKTRVRELINCPAKGDLLDPRSNERDALPAKVETKIAMTKRPDRRPQPARLIFVPAFHARIVNAGCAFVRRGIPWRSDVQMRSVGAPCDRRA